MAHFSTHQFELDSIVDMVSRMGVPAAMQEPIVLRQNGRDVVHTLSEMLSRFSMLRQNVEPLLFDLLHGGFSINDRYFMVARFEGTLPCLTTLLHDAIRHGSSKYAGLLLELGADPSVPTADFAAGVDFAAAMQGAVPVSTTETHQLLAELGDNHVVNEIALLVRSAEARKLVDAVLLRSSSAPAILSPE